MNIGFDLDGVLVQWHESIYEYYIQNNKFKGSFSDFWTDYWRKEPVQSELKYLVTVPIFYTNKVPLPSTLNLLNLLAENHELFYITARPAEVETATRMYFDKWKFPFTENLYVVDNSYSGGGDKTTLMRNLGIDLYIDDRESYVKDLSKICFTILRAQPWNKDYWDKYPTIHNLSEVLNYIKD